MNQTTVPLADIAHARAGDKGDTSILMVAPYQAEDYKQLTQVLSPQALAAHFGTDISAVTVNWAPGLTAGSIVLRGVLTGGVTRSHMVDPHGKTLSGHLLAMLVAWHS